MSDEIVVAYEGGGRRFNGGWVDLGGGERHFSFYPYSAYLNTLHLKKLLPYYLLLFTLPINLILPIFANTFTPDSA